MADKTIDYFSLINCLILKMRREGGILRTLIYQVELEVCVEPVNPPPVDTSTKPERPESNLRQPLSVRRDFHMKRSGLAGGCWVVRLTRVIICSETYFYIRPLTQCIMIALL